MRTEQLEQFVKIVDEGSMSEAARKLFVSRSSLSSAMKTLENELGAPLFERVSKGVLLTPFGVAVYHNAIDILRRIGHLKKSKMDNMLDTLTIAHMYNPPANDAFAEFCNKHKNETIYASIEETGLNGVVSSVSEGFAEIGIITMFPNGEKLALIMLDNNGLEYHELAQNTLCIMVGPNNPLYHRKKDSVTLEELSEFPMLEHYSAPSHQNMEIDLGYRGAIAHNGYIKVADLGLAMRLVATTDVVFMNGKSLNSNLKTFADTDYRCLSIEDVGMHTRIGWVKSIHKELSPATEEYLEIYRRKLKEELENY